jgi:hypothetical protein
MSNASDYLEVELRRHLFRTGSFAKPAALYVSLHTANPTDAGTGTEVTGGSYARVACNPADANWSAASATDGVTANVAAITFPTPSAGWGTVTHFGIWDAASGGNLLVHGALTGSQVISSGALVAFAAGALIVTIA